MAHHTELKQRVSAGDGLAAVLLARVYAHENKAKESCVCMRIAQILNPEAITPADTARNAIFWGRLGKRVREVCMQKAANSVKHIRSSIVIS
jgi:hypothetical protein